MANNLSIQNLTNVANEILKTLPLAKYLRTSTIPVALDTSADTSYFDPSQFRIVVALNNILKSIATKAKSNLTINDSEIEKTIRGLLYHEISHAIMTPRDAMCWANSYKQYNATQNPSPLLDAEFFNIIEDERIETILSKYYLGVDFKSNFKSIATLTPATNFKHFVFNAVRFRYSPIEKQKVNKVIDDFIAKTSRISSASNGSVAYDTLIRNADRLLQILHVVWEQLLQLAQQNKQNQKSGKTDKTDPTNTADTEGETEQNEDPIEDDSEGNETNVETDGITTKSGKKDAKQNEQEKQDSSSNSSEQLEEENEQTEQIEDPTPYVSDDMQTLEAQEVEISDIDIENIVDKSVAAMVGYGQMYNGNASLQDFALDKKTYVDFYKIIVRNRGFGAAKAPITFGYCGKVNAKKIMKDHHDTMKVFEKKNFVDNYNKGKKAEKKILNLFIDNSGSFCENDAPVNLMLRALQEIEHKVDDFEFRFIRWGDQATQLYGNERVSHSDMGTRLDATFTQAVKRNTKTGKEYNIFLTDGAIGGSLDPLKLFNNKQSVLITESGNVYQMRALCPNARAIIVENTNYAERLAENVAKALEALL